MPSMPTKVPAPRGERPQEDTQGNPPTTIPTAPRIVRATFATGARIVNPVVRRLAGTRSLPLYALVQHRGRRSGRLYATPVVARPTPDGFVIPLPFGDRADWFRNVRAAGGCVIRWKGNDCPVVAPEVITLAEARPAFTRVERALIPLVGVQRFVRLRRAPAAPTGGLAR